MGLSHCAVAAITVGIGWPEIAADRNPWGWLAGTTATLAFCAAWIRPMWLGWGVQLTRTGTPPTV
jgi:hypothetical protein